MNTQPVYVEIYTLGLPFLQSKEDVFTYLLYSGI